MKTRLLVEIPAATLVNNTTLLDTYSFSLGPHLFKNDKGVVITCPDIDTAETITLMSRIPNPTGTDQWDYVKGADGQNVTMYYTSSTDRNASIVIDQPGDYTFQKTASSSLDYRIHMQVV